MDTLYANMTVSVTDVKRNFAEIIKQTDECPVAILNHNRPAAYLVPAAHYERLMNYLEDLEDAKLIRDRAAGPFIEVGLDEL